MGEKRLEYPVTATESAISFKSCYYIKFLGSHEFKFVQSSIFFPSMINSFSSKIIREGIQHFKS